MHVWLDNNTQPELDNKVFGFLSPFSSYFFLYTTLTNFSTKYLQMCKVYTDVGGIK